MRWWKVGPPTGDDITPIENLWAILDDRLESKKFSTEKGMKKAIRQVWNEVDLSTLHNLIHSIPATVCGKLGRPKEALIKAVN